MASMKDALEESFQDINAWIKYLVFAVPLYFLTVMIFEEKSQAAIIALAIPVFIFFLGFALICTYNVRKGNNRILPSFNIFYTLWVGLKCLAAITPFLIFGLVISSIIIHFLSGLFPEGIFLNIFKGTIYAIFSSFAITSYLLFSRDFSFKKAYDLKKVFTYCIDVFAALLIMIILLIIVDVIIVAPITYIIWLFLGIPSLPAIYAWSAIVVLNIAMIGHYMAQIDYEIIPLDADEQDNIVARTLSQQQQQQK